MVTDCAVRSFRHQKLKHYIASFDEIREPPDAWFLAVDEFFILKLISCFDFAGHRLNEDGSRVFFGKTFFKRIESPVSNFIRLLAEIDLLVSCQNIE